MRRRRKEGRKSGKEWEGEQRRGRKPERENRKLAHATIHTIHAHSICIVYS